MANPCTEMVGFTRLLASANGQPDGQMEDMPTVTVAQAGFDKTRGFQVINRPWTMLKFINMPEFQQRIKEDYVYIAETDHLILNDIPNRATPELNVAFFFPYMSPVPAEQSRVVKRYYDGDHLSVQPIGPSPAILHVDMLKKVTPLWYDLSVKLKADRDADRAFGWVLEMWGYSLAAARVGGPRAGPGAAAAADHPWPRECSLAPDALAVAMRNRAGAVAARVRGGVVFGEGRSSTRAEEAWQRTRADRSIHAQTT